MKTPSCCSASTRACLPAPLLYRQVRAALGHDHHRAPPVQPPLHAAAGHLFCQRGHRHPAPQVGGWVRGWMGGWLGGGGSSGRPMTRWPVGACLAATPCPTANRRRRLSACLLAGAGTRASPTPCGSRAACCPTTTPLASTTRPMAGSAPAQVRAGPGAEGLRLALILGAANIATKAQPAARPGLAWPWTSLTAAVRCMCLTPPPPLPPPLPCSQGVREQH